VATKLKKKGNQVTRFTFRTKERTEDTRGNSIFIFDSADNTKDSLFKKEKERTLKSPRKRKPFGATKQIISYGRRRQQ
jgi:hypothetical protein